MGQRIAIRSLIEQRKAKAGDDGTDSSGLPPSIAHSLPLWDIVAERAAEVLEPLVQCPLQASVELSILTHGELRSTEAKPGVTMAMDPPERGGLIRFPGQSASILTSLLLRAADVHAPEDAEPEELDGLVVTSIFEAIGGLIYAAFGIALRLPPNVEPKMIWPLTPPPPEPRLFVRFTLKITDHPDVHLELLFRDTCESIFSELMQRGEEPMDLAGLSIEVRGILSRWSATTKEIVALEPGDRVIIPGGDLADVALEAETAIGTRPLARAELGTIRGRHGLRVLALAGA
ncbi:MAG: FliM/FliN family flagellar motor C-terminal domain-containing protein [Pseudomonadota bacterium]